MKKIKMLLLSLVACGSVGYFLLANVVYAQEALTGKERSARIDVYSQNEKTSLLTVKSNGNVFPGTGNPADTWAWIGQLDLTDQNKWVELWVEFTPTESGWVVIELRGGGYNDLKINHHEVWVDEATVKGEGAQFENSSFEEITDKGNPVGWNWLKPSIDDYSRDGIYARSGKACVKVWHDNPVGQRIAVKALEKYRVSAWFKPYYAQVSSAGEKIY